MWAGRARSEGALKRKERILLVQPWSEAALEWKQHVLLVQPWAALAWKQCVLLMQPWSGRPPQHTAQGWKRKLRGMAGRAPPHVPACGAGDSGHRTHLTSWSAFARGLRSLMTMYATTRATERDRPSLRTHSCRGSTRGGERVRICVGVHENARAVWALGRAWKSRVWEEGMQKEEALSRERVSQHATMLSLSARAVPRCTPGRSAEACMGFGLR